VDPLKDKPYKKIGGAAGTTVSGKGPEKKTGGPMGKKLEESGGRKGVGKKSCVCENVAKKEDTGW